jgi:uncharacterized protein YdhG (YjbR/CyaY superfamily)
VISKAADVASYIEELPEDRRPIIKKLRALCRKHLLGYQESMDYGMPVYKRNGVMEVAFASQKQYIALYALKKEALDEFRPMLAGAKIGKGCIRFRNSEQIDFDVLKRLLERHVESKAAPC